MNLTNSVLFVFTLIGQQKKNKKRRKKKNIKTDKKTSSSDMNTEIASLQTILWHVH